MLENLLNESSSWQLLLAFGAGFLSSFTPCIFPLIPITLSLFGVKENTSALRGFLLSFSYVCGIATTYTALGMLSAKTGIVFGSYLGNIYVIILLSAFLFLMALSSLEAIQLTFLSKLQSTGNKIGGQGTLGAYLMGLASGFVAAPCIGPALVVILGLAAKSPSVSWGALLLLSYSFGLGLIFIFLGTFSQAFKILPKSGNWLNFSKFIIASALIMIVIFLNQKLLSSILLATQVTDIPIFLLLIENLAIYMAWYSYRHENIVIRIAASILLAFAVFQFVFPNSHATKNATTSEQTTHNSWHTNLEEAIALGKTNSKIVMVDLFADWCVGCKELDSNTFPNPDVQKILSSLVTARIDFTDVSAPTPAAITAKYSIAGLPCILFLKPDGSGEEIPNSRITGYLPPKDFLEHFKKYITPGS
jgi:thioredoxin:protein disulfide reductase